MRVPFIDRHRIAVQIHILAALVVDHGLRLFPITIPRRAGLDLGKYPQPVQSTYLELLERDVE